MRKKKLVLFRGHTFYERVRYSWWHLKLHNKMMKKRGYIIGQLLGDSWQLQSPRIFIFLKTLLSRVFLRVLMPTLSVFFMHIFILTWMFIDLLNWILFNTFYCIFSRQLTFYLFNLIGIAFRLCKMFDRRINICVCMHASKISYTVNVNSNCDGLKWSLSIW